MATLSKTNRISRVRKASNAAGIALKRLEDLSNSGNPDVAARATAMLVLERNEQDDLKVIQQVLENKPAASMKPISDETLALLDALENSIDTRIKNNQVINATISAATEMLRTAESIGQILKES